MSTESTQKWGNGLVELRPEGLYCAEGGFYIDPWKKVKRALITHAHSDHARSGSEAYLTAKVGVGVLTERIGKGSPIEGIAYGESQRIGDVSVSFHPAGHVLGSGQIRIERAGRVAVVTGDYKVHADCSCHQMEPVRCDTFITECTFGLPLFQWPDPSEVFGEMNCWWQSNRDSNRTSVMYVYSLGKAQRVLAGINSELGPIAVHRSILNLLPHYEAEGFSMPAVVPLSPENFAQIRGSGLILAPAAAQSTNWARKVGDISDSSASGWMQVRGMRRWNAYDRGFVLSDHVDWRGLMDTIEATGAEHIGATHGYTSDVVKYLRETGRDAFEVPTRFTGDSLNDEA
ncbi:MAG: ligase-associated DNA damage response exonuclease [Verrucomicrobiota bacterium]